MIDIANWKFEDLDRFVKENLSEDSHLDFKDSRAIADWSPDRRSELAKDVSAFANAGGGILIYGATETSPQGEEGVPKFDHFDDGIPNALRREAIEDILTSEHYIHKRIDGLKIRPIEVPNSPENRYYLVIAVPVSSRAPHMHNPSKRYYKRHNFKTEPMEGYEVEDIRNRTVVPQVRFSYQFRLERQEGSGEVHYYETEFYLENVGVRTLRACRVEIQLPHALQIDYQLKAIPLNELMINKLPYWVFGMNCVSPEKPLFPDQKLTVCSMNYKVNRQIYWDLEGRNLKFYWRIFLDDAPAQMGEDPVSKLHKY